MFSDFFSIFIYLAQIHYSSYDDTDDVRNQNDIYDISLEHLQNAIYK